MGVCGSGVPATTVQRFRAEALDITSLRSLSESALMTTLQQMVPRPNPTLPPLPSSRVHLACFSQCFPVLIPRRAGSQPLPFCSCLQGVSKLGWRLRLQQKLATAAP